MDAFEYGMGAVYSNLISIWLQKFPFHMQVCIGHNRPYLGATCWQLNSRPTKSTPPARCFFFIPGSSLVECDSFLSHKRISLSPVSSPFMSIPPFGIPVMSLGQSSFSGLDVRHHGKLHAALWFGGSWMAKQLQFESVLGLLEHFKDISWQFIDIVIVIECV